MRRGSNTNEDRRAAKTVLEYWPLIVVAVGGVVTAITFWNNVNGLIAEQKSFKATVDARRDQSHKDMEDVRTRLTKLEQRMDDEEWLRKSDREVLERH